MYGGNKEGVGRGGGGGGGADVWENSTAGGRQLANDWHDWNVWNDWHACIRMKTNAIKFVTATPRNTKYVRNVFVWWN